VAESAPESGSSVRFKAGIATFVLAFAIHLVTLVVFLVGAPPGTVAAVGAIVFALNKVLLIVCAAILGRDGFNRLKGMVFGGVRQYVFQAEVGPIRHGIGLVLFVVPIVFAWVSPYLEQLAPSIGRHTVQAGITGDILLLVSLFVLGGSFWEKLRALFIRNATVVLPGDAR
jgi:hypothetical protein